jgi:hypothetical protein
MTADDLLNTLQGRGWDVKRAKVRAPQLLRRYSSIPQSFREFSERFERCVHPDEDAWFLSGADYEGRSDSVFRWNEFEELSLEAAEGDEEWRDEIRIFWDCYLPIAISVRSGYSYLALSIRGNGAVVYGREPDFEDVTEVAVSFELLSQRIIAGDRDDELVDFL